MSRKVEKIREIWVKVVNICISIAYKKRSTPRHLDTLVVQNAN